MPDIFHDFPITASPSAVYEAVSTPKGLDHWWTARSTGIPQVGMEYQLWFGPQYDWRAVVTHSVAGAHFELEITRADADWTRTRVGFHLTPEGSTTQVRFYHSGWPELTGHYRISCYCWAMYLRVLKRFVEYGEQVPNDQRLSV